MAFFGCCQVTRRSFLAVPGVVGEDIFPCLLVCVWILCACLYKVYNSFFQLWDGRMRKESERCICASDIICAMLFIFSRWEECVF